MNRLSILLIILFLSMYSIVSQGQVGGQASHLTIETIPPDSIIVCGDSAFFSVEITNTHSQQLSDLVFNPKMIPGMIYIAGSVTGMTEQNITTLNEPLFELNQIAPNQTIVLTFYAKAECSIIDQIINLGNGASSNGLATNQTRVDYVNNGTAQFSLELNGSDSYNILYADIFISTITNQVEQTIPGAMYTRSISIQNGGLGKVESLTLLIDFESGIAVSGTNIGDFNLNGQLATVTLGPAEFAMFGNGDGYFELDEVITLVDSVTMITCDGGETKYTAFWGCNALDTCQKDDAYANTILVGGQPILQSDIVVNEPTFFGCADTGVIVVEYNNVGIESSVGGANYYNVKLRYESNQEIVNYVGMQLNGVDLFAAGVPRTTVVLNANGNDRERVELLLDNFFTTDPDGPGGLEDLDNDGYYDDMASGETLLATYQYLLESPMSFADCPTNFNYQFFRETIFGNNNCGMDIAGQISRNGHVQGYPDGAALVTGPSDIRADDTITITFENSFIFDEYGRFKSAFPSSFISTLKCDSSQVKTYLTMDPGFQIVPGSVLVNGLPATFTVNGSLVTIFGGELVGRQANNQISLDLTYDCNVPVTVGGILEWRTVLSCDCGDEINLGCQDQFISRHCPGPPCFGTKDFVVNRASFGWTDDTQTTPVTASTPGVVLSRAYQCDTVCAYASGDVGVGGGVSLDNAHVNVWYRAPGLDRSFNYGRGEWIIFDASTGITHRVPTSTPSFTTNGAPASTHQMTFDATSAITSTVGTLEDGDSLNIKLYLEVNKTSDFPLGAYQFPRFRAQHAYIDAVGDTITCSSFGAGFTILKTKTLIQTQSGSTNLGNFAPCGEHRFLFGSKLIGGLGIFDDYPNEFRPVNVWDDTLCYTLPQGVYYVPGTIQFNNGPASTVSPLFDPVTRKLTFIGSELYADGWPLLDRVDDIVRTIEFRVSRDCDAIVGNNIIPSQYGYTDYSYAQDPACYEHEVANTDWDITIDKPKLEMDASLTVIEGFDRELKWTVRLCNNGNVFSNNNWIYINDTSSNLTVSSIIDLSNGGISVPFTQVGTFIYINAGMILESSCIDLEISSLNNDCTPGQIHTLEVFSGWSCTPDSVYNPMACHTDTIPLQYITKRANLQTQVTFPVGNMIDICAPFDFDVLLISSLEGSMGDISHFIELPVGLSIQPGATYVYPLGTAPQALPAPTPQFGGNLGWDLSAIIPGLANSFVGTNDTTRNKLRLNYSLVAGCDFDPYNLIGINSHGYTNCNELVDLTARKKIIINGFPQLDTTEVSLSLVDNSSTCVNQVSAVVNVENQSMGNLGLLNNLEVTLPAGMSYVMGSHIPDPVVQAQGGGVDRLTFTYPNPLASGATATFNFEIELDQTLTCGPYSVIARSIVRDSALCVAAGENCEIGATTGVDTSEIAIQTTIDPSFASSVVEPCLGDSFNLTSVATCGTHFWDFGDGNTSTDVNPTHTYNGATGGLYTITHIITSNCSADTNVTTINVLDQCCQLSLSLTATAINCNGNCDGTTTVVVSNGTAPYTYLWSNLSTGATATNLCAGAYSVTVIDAAGCSETGTVNVTDNTVLFEGTIASTNISCAGTCDGTAATSLIGGVAPYTYAWSNGSTSSSLSGLCAGTYSVTGTDANGCVVVLTTVITEPAAMILTTTSTGINNCTGTCDGTATASTTGGTAPYTYAWSNGGTGSSLNALCAGAYSVTATDANGCSSVGTVNVDSVAVLTGTISSTDVSCAVTCDGTAAANLTSGTAPYTYAWSNGSTSSSLSGLCAGTYSVTGTDANGCVVVLTTVITEPAAMILTTTSTGINNCTGTCDGIATASTTGGTAPYAYAWSNGGTGSSLNALCAGFYSVTATDANGCSSVGTVNVDSVAVLAGTISSTDVSCAGICDGTASANLTSGTAPYTYAWSNGSTSSSLSGLCAGTYSVTGTDANGCVVVLTTVITEPAAMILTTTSTGINNCTGTCDGTATASTTGGTAPYTYAWSNGGTGSSLNALCAGAYSVTATDANGCSSVGTVNVDSVAVLAGTISSTNVSCAGTCDGTASANLTSGTAPYTYAWSNGSTSSSLSGLCAGTYSVTGTDANGCAVVLTTVITEPAAMVLTTTSTGINNCGGTCNGIATASATGGTAPYTYAWSNGGTGSSLNALCAGTYSVTAIDANGCSSIGTVNVDSVASLEGSITSTDATCAGTCDGTASTTPIGGTAPYTFAWSNGSTASSLSNLCAGTYVVTITDANGCDVVLTTVVTEPTALSVNVITTDASCSNNMDSSTCVATAWRNNRHAVWLPNLPNTPDRKFVFENNSGRLHEYPNGTARITGTIVNRSNPNQRWAVDVHFTNGMNWTNWSALGRSYKDQSGLAGQNYLNWTYYIMDVTKSNTLTGLGSYSGTVLNLTHRPANYTYGLQVGLGANDKDGDYGFSTWFRYTSTDGTLRGRGDFNADLNCASTPVCDGTAQVNTTGGTAPYTYTWSNGSTGNNLNGLCADTFNVTVTDANGCSTNTIVIIDAEQCCNVSIAATHTDATCAGTCDGTITTTSTGGTAPYTYAWSNGSTNSSLNTLCAGTYTVTVTDANGCEAILTTVITEPTALAINVTTTDVSCNPGVDSTICIATAWRSNRHAIKLPDLPNTPDSKFIFENNSGRLYEYPDGTARITGTIVNNSDATKRFAVDVHFTNGMDWTSWSALGRNYRDQSGTAGQNYLDWTYYIMDVTKSNTLTGLGVYTGTVLNLAHRPANYNYGMQVGIGANSKDADYGFAWWFNYTVTGPACIAGRGNFNADINCTDVVSCDGTAQVNTTGGTAPYTYNWSNGSSNDSLNGLCADTLTLTVTDANGCSTSTVVVIEEEDCCSSSTTVTNTSCPGSCDGTINVINTNGTAPYTYQWNNGASGCILNNVCAGTYTVTVTDANGCVSIVTTVVTSPDPIVVTVDTVTTETCTGNDATATINVTGGTAPYTIDLANFTTGTTYSNSTGTFTGLNAGQYLVNVIDANGCTIECATTFVVENDCCTPGTNVAPGTGANVSNPTLRINSTPSVIQINYETSEKVTGISILDANGKVFLNNEALHGTGNLEIPRDDLKGNTYWIILRGENDRLLETKKLILSE